MCGNCGFKRDGLNRKPSVKDTLHLYGIEFDTEGRPISEVVEGRYAIEVLLAADAEVEEADSTGKAEAKWDVKAAFGKLDIALQYAKILATIEDSAPTVRVMDTDKDKELWHCEQPGAGMAEIE